MESHCFTAFAPSCFMRTNGKPQTISTDTTDNHNNQNCPQSPASTGHTANGDAKSEPRCVKDQKRGCRGSTSGRWGEREETAWRGLQRPRPKALLSCTEHPTSLLPTRKQKQLLGTNYLGPTSGPHKR